MDDVSPSERRVGYICWILIVANAQVEFPHGMEKMHKELKMEVDHRRKGFVSR